MARFEYTLFADYFQFYIQDETAGDGLGDSWDDVAVQRMLATAAGAIGVGTVRNTDVSVIVEVLDGEPILDLDVWDQVNECHLDVPSGRIVVAGCTDYFPDAARIELRSMTYHTRISYGCLDSLSEDGLDGEDHYLVQLWPGMKTDVTIVKDRSAHHAGQLSR